MDTVISSMVKNPYVGPQSFDRSMKNYFFGRDEEAHRLFYMVQAHQLVLFYAQSGAGKSSLIQARLIPDLEDIGWFVFPIGRVVGSKEDIEEQTDINFSEGNVNPFTFNLINYLTQKKMEVRRSEFSATTICQRNLVEFFNSIIYRGKEYELSLDLLAGENSARDQENETIDKVLIIDQFEELLTTNLTFWNKRADFFKQINDLLNQDPCMHVVLVAREEYIPGLISYTNDIEGGIRHRFYMQRLDEKGAELAINEPVKKFNRRFSPEAVKNLIDDLRTIRTGKRTQDKSSMVSEVSQAPNSAVQRALGQFVDPMMLQIFCYQLWEEVGQESGDITDDYREKTGGVENALGNFYAQKVNEIARKCGVGEFLLRKWIERNLISGDNRVFVYEGIAKPAGITNSIWVDLEEARLIHSVPHEDRKTYELTHDRLVYVIKENNKRWREKNLTPLQKAALKWHDLGERDDSLLLRRNELREFKAWIDQNPNKLMGGKIEEDFRDKSQKAINSTNLKYIFGITASILFVCLIIAAVIIYWGNQGRKLEIANYQATLTQYAANQNLLETSSILNSEQKAQIAQQNLMAQTQLAISIEKGDLSATHVGIAKTSVANVETSVAQKATAEKNATEALSRQLASQGKSYLENNIDLGILLSLAGYQIDPSTWEARSALLAGLSAGLEQNVEPYELTIPSSVERVRSIDISPDGRTVAWGGAPGRLILWDVQTKTSRIIDVLNQKSVYTLAFSPIDPNILVTGNQTSEIFIWNLRDGTFQGQQIASDFYDDEFHFLGKVRILSFSGDGRLVAVHGENPYIKIWDVYEQRQINSFRSPAAYYWDLAWSPNNLYLAATGDDKLLYIFDPRTGTIVDTQVNPGGNVPIYNVDWSPDGKTLAFGGNVADAQARVYFYDIQTKDVLQDYLEYQGLTVYALAYDKPEGKYLMAAGSNQPINIWNVKDKKLIANFSTYNAYQFGLSFRKGKLAAVSDNSINVFSLSLQEPLSKKLAAPPGVALALGVDDGMNLWIINQSGEELILQSQVNRTPYRIGSDILGHVVLADLYFAKDSPVLLTYNDAGIIQQWETDGVQPLILELGNIDKNLTSLAISADGNELAVSYCDEPTPTEPQTACYVQTLMRTAVNKFVSDQKAIISQSEILKLDFNWTGDMLIIASGDGKITTVDLSTGKQNIIPLQVITFMLSPDEKTLAIGTADGKLALWDLGAGQEIGVLSINSNVTPISLAYALDGSTLYAAFSNSAYLSFDVDLNDWFNRLCNIVGRDMTFEEWNQFVSGEPYQEICAPVLEATATPSP